MVAKIFLLLTTTLSLIPFYIHSIQANSSLVMVRPFFFGSNSETALSNAFQCGEGAEDSQEIACAAKEEFDRLVLELRRRNIEVNAIDEEAYSSPDSIFPNNWFSIDPHESRLFLYPMMAENRRRERGGKVIDLLCQRYGVEEVVDLTEWEREGRFLEGTGSIVFDYVVKKGYACLSPRTDRDLFIHLCTLLGYTPVVFHASDRESKAIYHTNVMMAIGTEVAIICSESIDERERKSVIGELVESGKIIVEISFAQMENFCGNLLEVADREGKRYFVMSTRAYNAFTKEQIETITRYNEIIHSPIDTIEKVGGGGVRCMLAGAWGRA